MKVPREINFRGKSRATGEWLYGDYLRWNSAVTIIPHIKAEDIDIAKVLVIPETVGQYTGVSDRCGQPIYEGDVIEIEVVKEEFEQAVIKFGEYGNKHIGFYVYFLEEKKNEMLRQDLGYWVKKCRVTGDIFSNLEGE
ncbi:YopX family protein [Caldicellulosiruptor acetigenus]|uniref:YopX family protein n=1 Tax=Caldicellulosiruptor acetigenus TaxID=301953 RepID=UPI0022A97CA8|nr:YopX family protein [Caldicellulosiruptor acetigenus]WAM36571.1 YopX family protein [Caldicellulosiruptor acetigenus]